jgi:DNA-binding LacI/PurR family transcriptional regulator
MYKFHDWIDNGFIRLYSYGINRLTYKEKDMAKKITINDIAKLSGVSKTTVSFYLNGKFEKMSEDTKHRIESAIDKTNYRPNAMARSLNYKQTQLIGVIIGDITNSFANQIVKGIDDYAREHGYQMIVGSSNYDLENEKICVSGMAGMGADGFIVQPTVHFETMWSESNVDKPIVYFDSPNNDDAGMWVKTNNYEAVYEATEELSQQKYDNYVMITADPYVLKTRMERTRGFTDCLDIKKLPYEVIVADAKTTPEDLEKKLQGYLNDRKKSTLVFVANNWLLDKTYLALKKYKNLIPKQLGLIGFDSLEWSEMSVPSITTIVQPAYEEGQTAAKILIDAIEDKNEVVPNCILPCRMNRLESTNHEK